GASQMPSLSKLHERWRRNSDRFLMFPFGEDPGGDCIAMRENGEIIRFDFTAESESDCLVLAASFGEFLNDVLMGAGFYSLFDVPASELEDNEWLVYLRQKGWL
ncbi:MAG: SMI1/KNR4 family protein, partial [Planctomycetaceae bacterium]|nr:SMI1/KNR4 family protein [Planctomycetaceae bacterium]